jgi:hypothetical protein
MAGKRSIEFRFGLNSKDFDAGQKKAVSGMQRMGRVATATKAKIAGIGTGLKGALGGALGMIPGAGFAGAMVGGLGLAAIGAGIGVMVKETKEGQLSLRNLENALKRAGTTYQAEKPKIDRYAQAISNAYNFEDNDVQDGITQLIDSGYTLDGALRQTGFAADIARKKKISYADASRAIGLAYQGNTKALRSFGIVMESTGNKAVDAQRALAELRKVSEGSAAAFAEQDTFGRLSIQLQNVAGIAGDKATPAISGMVDKVSDFVTGLDPADIEAFGASIGKTFEEAGSIVGFFADKAGKAITAFAAIGDMVEQGGGIGKMAGNAADWAGAKVANGLRYAKFGALSAVAPAFASGGDTEDKKGNWIAQQIADEKKETRETILRERAFAAEKLAAITPNPEAILAKRYPGGENSVDVDKVMQRGREIRPDTQTVSPRTQEAADNKAAEKLQKELQRIQPQAKSLRLYMPNNLRYQGGP